MLPESVESYNNSLPISLHKSVNTANIRFCKLSDCYSAST